MIYLDNASTTAISEEVLEAMMPYLTWKHGNAGSLHSMGREAHDAIQHAREQVARFINAFPDQIIFTSGGTEANNMVVHDAMFYYGHRKRIITTEIEHDSILRASDDATRYGENILKHVLKPDSHGVIDVNNIRENFIDKYTDIALTIALLSVMHTNNELGSVNPIEEIGSLCYEFRIPFHTDCVQAAGFSELDVEKFKCDFLTLSSHKIHGPKGVGALYVRYPEEFAPLILGGKSQEFGLRGGTENVAGIVGFGKACELAGEHLEENRHKIMSNYKTFTDALECYLDVRGILGRLHYNSPRPSKVLNIRFDGIRSESLLMMLDAEYICVSAGSACNASNGEPSHVLKAIGLTDDEARSSIRVSFSKDNTFDDCDIAASVIAKCVKSLLKM